MIIKKSMMLRFMQTKTFSFLTLVLFVFLRSNLVLSASVVSVKENESGLVTADDYCEFLNAVAQAAPEEALQLKLEVEAVNTPNDFYDEKMSSNSRAASILRSGRPGDYRYEVIKGKEDAVMNYLSQNAAVDYDDWLQNAASTSTDNFNGCQVATSCVAACDEQLRSNHHGFYITKGSIDATKKNSGKGKTGASLGKTILGVGTLLAVALGEGEREALERNAMGAEDHTEVFEGAREEHRCAKTTIASSHVASPVIMRTEEKERLEISKILQQAALRKETDSSYQEPETLWSQLLQACEKSRAPRKSRKSAF